MVSLVLTRARAPRLPATVTVCHCRALQQFETFHEGESIRLHQFEIMQVANLMQADSEVEEVGGVHVGGVSRLYVHLPFDPSRCARVLFFRFVFL